VDLSIVVPAYNEEGNLSDLLDDLAALRERLPCASEVVVVDDGSRDGTARILAEQAERRPWLRALSGRVNAGMGAALRAGTAAARYPLVAWVMADRSDRLGDLIPMRERIVAGADLVVASRAARTGSYGDLGGSKAVGSRVYSRFAGRLLGIPIGDLTNAFRVFRRTLIDRVDLTRNDFAVSPEMVIRAAQAGLRIEEVPTVYSFRRHGMSNFKVVQMATIYYALAIRARFVPPRGGRGR
jgi:dolichol-phosphate mannosyltransferase